MFHQLKSLALAAAFVTSATASGMAQADVFVPTQAGLGTWTLSVDGRDVFEATGISVSTPTGYTGSYDGELTINIPFSSVATSGGDVLQRLSTGPTFDLNRELRTGIRTAAISDLALDLATLSITGHLSGIDQNTHNTTDYGVMTLFSLTDLTDSTSGYSFSGQMTMAPAATDALFNILVMSSISGPGSIKDLYQSTSWGTFTTQAAPVPEPGTCALMLLGLTGVVLAAKRRHQA